MLIVAISVIDYLDTAQQILQAVSQADGLEFRLDALITLDFNAIKTLRHASTLPVIFTVRNQSQGGQYPYDDSQRYCDILALCALQPDYFDLEYDVPLALLEQIATQFPRIKVISSYHHFEKTPTDILKVFQGMQRPYVYAYKIATQAQSTLDALRMMQFVRQVSDEHRVIGLCMGDLGQCTRILSPIMGNIMSYACMAQTRATAPGQLLVEELLTQYHYHQLNSKTKIYALWGDPIHLSVGHVLHNQAISYLKRDAVYIKLRVAAEELPLVIALCREMRFEGMSITMPLKERIVPFLDAMTPASQAIQAINSVVRQQNQFIGFNTDGLGALNALAKYVTISQQTILILGAGGAARAIAYEAVRQQAKVIILNRTLAKAVLLAEELGCQAYELEVFPRLQHLQYTVLINTLPEYVFGHQIIIDLLHPDHILPNTLAMDIVYQPINTLFLQLARRADCQCIAGFEMYICQALLQLRQWFQVPDAELQYIKQMMYRYFA